MATRQQRISVDVESDPLQSQESEVRVGDTFVQNKRMIVPETQQLPLNDFIKIGKAMGDFSQSLGTMVNAMDDTKEEEQREARNKAAELLSSYKDHKNHKKLAEDVEALRGTYSDYAWAEINKSIGNKYASEFIARASEDFAKHTNADNTWGRNRETIEEFIDKSSSEWFTTGGRDGGWLEDPDFKRAFYETTEAWKEGYVQKVLTSHKQNTAEKEAVDLHAKLSDDLTGFMTSTEGYSAEIGARIKTEVDAAIAHYNDLYGGKNGDIPAHKISELTQGVFLKVTSNLGELKDEDGLIEFQQFMETQITNQAEVDEDPSIEFKVKIKGLSKIDAKNILNGIDMQQVIIKGSQKDEESEEARKKAALMESKAAGFMATEAFKNFNNLPTDKQMLQLTEYYKGLVKEDGTPMFDDVSGKFMQQELRGLISSLSSSGNILEQQETVKENKREANIGARISAANKGIDAPENYSSMSEEAILDYYSDGEPFSPVARARLKGLIQNEAQPRNLARASLGYDKSRPEESLSGTAAVIWNGLQGEMIEARDAMEPLSVDAQQRKNTFISRLESVANKQIRRIAKLSATMPHEELQKEIEKSKQQIADDMNALYQADADKAKEESASPLGMIDFVPSTSANVSRQFNANQLASLGHGRGESIPSEDVVRRTQLSEENADIVMENLGKVFDSELTAGEREAAGAIALPLVIEMAERTTILQAGWDEILLGGEVPIINANRDLSSTFFSSLMFGSQLWTSDVEMTNINLDAITSGGMSKLSDGEYTYIKKPVEGQRYVIFGIYDEASLSGDEIQSNQAKATLVGLRRMKEMAFLQGPDVLTKVMELDGNFRLDNTDPNSLIIPFTGQQQLELFAPRQMGLTKERRTGAEWGILAEEARLNTDAWRESDLGKYYARYKKHGGALKGGAEEYVKMEANAHLLFGMITPDK